MKRFLPWLALLMFAVGGLASGPVTAGPNVMTQKPGVGAKFGSRDPYACASTVAPKSGPISAALASQYFTCGFEHINEDGYLFLAEHATVQVGRGVPFREAGLYETGNIDPNGKVYAIRGSYDQYLCTPLSRYGAVRGHNCAAWHETHATGYCYRTTFGDWKCNMSDLDAQIIDNQPPPQN